MGGAAQAATLTVGSTADTSGATDCTVGTNTTCSLRDAIDAANGDPGSTITFRSGLSGTIMLESALPTITVPTTISGPGASQIAVSGEDAYRVFYISPSPGDDVSISGLTISDGASGTSTGAGVYSIDADFTLEDSVVTGNEAADADGGGVAVYRGSLTIESSTISGNIAGGEGGGVYTKSDSGAATTIRNSTISGNTAHAVYGGGGAYLTFDSPALIENSTIYNNHADNSGGGLFHFGAYDGDPGLTVVASTITHNSAGYSGGGIAGAGDTFRGHDISRPAVSNTIVSGNTASVGPDVSASYSTTPGTPIPGTLDAAFSLIGSVDPDTTIDQTIPGSDILGQDPQLGPLAGNGGPTQTQLPANTSPVVNKGSAFGLIADQRGLTRPVAFPGVPNSTAAGADGSDIGAVELPSPPVVIPVTPVSPQPQPQPQKKKKCKKKKKHKRSAESAKKKCKKKKKQ
jgi:CSLREA domain-containing protein